MKQLITLLLLIPLTTSFSQCKGFESVTLTPSPPYKSGDIVEVCYTLDEWVEYNHEFLEGFEINLSEEWENLTPLSPPNDNFVTSNGNWIWLNTSTMYDTITIGPGWFYEWVNSQDNNPTNDPGDWDGSISQYNPYSPWEFCFTTQLKNVCEYKNIKINIIAGSDGKWGPKPSSCPLEEFIVYEGSNGINLDSCETFVFIPNAFTPNGDGLNDILYIGGQGIMEMEWRIYDRWGNLVFETTSPSEGWDGENYPSNVFGYTINYISTERKYYSKTGTIQLIR